MNVVTISVITKSVLNIFDNLNDIIDDDIAYDLLSSYGMTKGQMVLLTKPSLRIERAIAIEKYITLYNKIPFCFENTNDFFACFENVIEKYILLEECILGCIKRDTAVNIFLNYFPINKHMLSIYFRCENYNYKRVPLTINEGIWIEDHVQNLFGKNKQIRIIPITYAKLLLKISYLYNIRIFIIERFLISRGYSFSFNNKQL